MSGASTKTPIAGGSRTAFRGNVVAVDLEEELDRLYRLSPPAFVGARNTLSKALRAEGDKDNAERVARLVRPSPVAWAVNQLHFEARERLDALRAASKTLRRAQEEQFDAEDFADARRVQKDALRAAMTKGLELAKEGGVATNAAFERKLEATLGLVGAAEDVSPPPGRMYAELEVMGFDALGTAAQPPAPSTRPKRSPMDDRRAETLATIKTSLDAVTREVRRLEQDAAASEQKHQRAMRDAEDAAERLTVANCALDEARAESDAAKRRLDAARVELAEARRVYEELAARTS